MSDFEPWEMRLAWQTALQARGCPPDRVLSGEDRDSSLSHHLSTCPFCSEAAAMGREEFEETALARELRRFSMPRPEAEPAPGQVCRVSERCVGWGPKGRYYNPPWVLVLDLPGDLPGAARVAQIYDDPVLAGPGDIPLGDDVFAESWNTYTLREEDLECCGGCVDEETLRQVKEGAALDWPAPPAGTHLEAFRRLEVEVAAFFALQALEEIMKRRERSPLEGLRALFPDGETLKGELSGVYPQIAWPEATGDAADLLARARFPESELPLAAAGEGETLPANLVVVRRGTVQLSPILWELRVLTPKEGGTVVGGKALASLPPRVELYGRWAAPGQPGRIGEVSFIDPETGYFRLYFKDISEPEWWDGKVFILLIGS